MILISIINKADDQIPAKKWNAQGIISFEPHGNGTKIVFSNNEYVLVQEDPSTVQSELLSGRNIIEFSVFIKEVEIDFECC